MYVTSDILISFMFDMHTNLITKKSCIISFEFFFLKKIKNLREAFEC